MEKKPDSTLEEKVTETSDQQDLPPEKKVYSDDHVCPIKEQRMAKRRGKPAHPVVKWSSRIVMALAIIPIILVLAFIGAINFMDYNQYKPQIESEFQKRTGYALKINGPIDVSVWPFALEAKQVELKNRSSFTSPNLAQIDSIQVELSLWNLFVNRHLELLGIELEKPHLFLETNAAGQHNWGLLKQRLAMTSQQSKAPGFKKVDYQVVTTPVAASDKTPELVDWHLDSFVLQNAIIEWQNEQAKTHLTMEDFDLMAFDISPNQPFKVLTNFQYDSSEIKSSFHFNVASMLTLNKRFSQWKLSDWTGNVRLVLPKAMQIPEVRVEMVGDLFELNFDQQKFHVEQARFRSLKGSLETSMSGTYGRNAETQGSLKAIHINLRKWFRHSGVTYPNFVDKTVLRDVSAEFNWSQTPEQFTVENLALQLDQSKITGNIWRKLQSEKPQYRFDLAISELNLDRYEAYVDSKASIRPVRKDAKPVSNTLKTAKPDSSVVTKAPKETYLPVGLPIKTLRALQAEGHLHIEKLKAWQMQMQAFEVNLSANAGKLQLAPLDANLYQGTLRSKLLVDVTGKTPRYDWSGRMEAVQLKPFLTDGWYYDSLEGQYNSSFNFNTLGVNSFLLKQNLNGSFNATVQNGQFKGMDLNKLLAGQKTDAKDATKFSRLSMVGDIQSGVLALRRMNVKSERFSAIGTGQLVLPTAQLNAVLHTTYHRPPQRLEQLKGVEVPVHLKGALGNVQWSVDLKKLLSNPANQKKLLNSLQQFLQAS